MNRDEQIIDMVKNGKPYSDIGEEFNLTKQRVQQIAKKHGIRINSEGGFKEIQRLNTIKQMIDDVNEGMDWRDIYKKYKRSDNRFGNYIKKAISWVVVRRYNQGETVSSIAQKYGYSERGIVSILKRNGVVSRNINIDERNKSIVMLHNKGYSITKIAELWKLSPDWIQKIVTNESISS